MASDPAIDKSYDDLPRQGVGANSWTREAILRLPPLRTPPAIINLGNGTGDQAIVLASHFRSPVEAVEDSAHSIDQMMDAARAAEVAEWIRPRLGSPAQPDDPPESYDLIWSEGGARAFGMELALKLWTPLLRKRGVLVVAECCWVLPDPPEDAVAFWSQSFPALSDAASVPKLAQTVGLRVYDNFTVPRSVWRSEYYEPLVRRLARLRKLPSDRSLETTTRQAETEIEMFNRWGDRLQYTFYLMRRI